MHGVSYIDLCPTGYHEVIRLQQTHLYAALSRRLIMLKKNITTHTYIGKKITTYMYTKHCTPTSCAGIWILEQLHQFNIYRPAQTNFPVACFLLYRFLLWQSLALLLHRYEPSILLQWPHLSHFQGRRRIWGCHGLWPHMTTKLATLLVCMHAGTSGRSFVVYTSSQRSRPAQIRFCVRGTYVRVHLFGGHGAKISRFSLVLHLYLLW